MQGKGFYLPPMFVELLPLPPLDAEPPVEEEAELGRRGNDERESVSSLPIDFTGEPHLVNVKLGSSDDAKLRMVD
jgi:hypothetical protein